VVHHIIGREIERRRIFRDDKDRYDSLTRLGKLVVETEINCVAWILLTRQLITLAIVIPAQAGHEVKRQRYPDRSWIPDQVRDDKGWPI